MIALAFLLTALAAPSLAGLPAEVEAAPFPGLERPRAVGCATLLGGLTLSGGGAFGGYSDLAVDPAAGTAILVSDAGHVLDLDLVMDGRGVVTGVTGASRDGMVDEAGSPLGKKTGGDAEGLAFTGRDHVVAFEGRDRLAVLRADGTLGPPLTMPKADERVRGLNAGYEALAFLADGDLLAITEGTGEDGLALVRRGRLDQDADEWRLTRYRPAADFAVTSAGVDPATGDLFVLERAFSIWRGPRARIVRVPADEVGAEVMKGREVARLSFFEGVDNMEGLDVHRTKTGALRLYLVSDDNYSAAQRTVLMTLGANPDCDGE